MKCPACKYQFRLFQGLKIDPNVLEVLRGSISPPDSNKYKRVCPNCKIELRLPTQYNIVSTTIFCTLFVTIPLGPASHFLVDLQITRQENLLSEVLGNPGDTMLIIGTFLCLLYALLLIRNWPIVFGDGEYELVATRFVVCKTCNSHNTDKSAIRCWRCNKKIKKKLIVDKIVGALAVASVMWSMLSAYEWYEDSWRRSESEKVRRYVEWKASLPEYTAAQLEAVYSQNIFAANYQFFNKYYKVNGSVKELKRDNNGGAHVVLYSGKYFSEIKFEVDSKRKNYLMGLRPNSPIALICVGRDVNSKFEALAVCFSESE